MQEHSSHALIQSASHTAGQGGLQPGGPTRTAESGDRECSQNQRWQPLRAVVPSHSLIQSSLHLRGCNAAQGACFLVVSVPPSTFAMVHVWRSEDNLWELFLSFRHGVFRVGRTSFPSLHILLCCQRRYRRA